MRWGYDAVSGFGSRRVSAHFGAVEVLQNVSLTIREGEFVAVVGPSGCGKTTLLNILSGFDQPTSGGVRTLGRGEDGLSSRTGCFPGGPPRRTSTWVSATWRTPPSARGNADEMLALIGLEGFAGHYPHQLSGGMRQRGRAGARAWRERATSC